MLTERSHETWPEHHANLTHDDLKHNLKRGTLCEAPLASVLPNNSAHIAFCCGTSLLLWHVTLAFPLCHVTPVIPFARIYAGHRDRASADWRICATSFEPRQRPADL